MLKIKYLILFQILLLDHSWSELYVLEISQNSQLIERLLAFIEQSRDLECDDDIKTLHINALKAVLKRLHSLSLDLIEYQFLKVLSFLKPCK